MIADPKTEETGADKSEETAAPRPQVIDLDAEEAKVEYEEVKAATSDPADIDEPVERAPEQTIPPPEATTIPPSPPPRTPISKGRSAWAWVVAALVLGLLAGGWLYRGVLSDYLPTNEMTAMKARVDVLEANGKTMNEQLLAVSQASDAAARAAQNLDGSLAEIKSAAGESATRLKALEDRLNAAETTLKAAKTDLDTLRNAVSTSGTGGGTADPAALAAIAQRIDALEKDVASLKSGTGGSDTANLTTALSQSLADLKAKVAAGASFQAEDDRIARMVPAAAGLDVLAAHAAQGLPDAKGLAAELRAAIPSLPQPEVPAAAGDGYWDWALESLSGIITVREIGVADWPQLAKKCAALAESGDLTQAITLLDDAEGTKPPPVTQWRDRAVARLKLEDAVGQVSEAVLRQISALGGAQ